MDEEDKEKAKTSSDEEEEENTAPKIPEDTSFPSETEEGAEDEEEEHEGSANTAETPTEPPEEPAEEDAVVQIPVFKKKEKKKIEILEEAVEEEIEEEVSLLNRHDSELTPQQIIEKDIMMYELLMAEEELMEMEGDEKPPEVVEEVVEEEEEEEEAEVEVIIEVPEEEVEVIEEVVVEEPPPAELDADFIALFNQAAEDDEEDELKTLFLGDLGAAEQELDTLANIDGVVGISLSDKTKEFFDLEDLSELPQKYTWLSFKKIKLHMYIYNELSEFFPFYNQIKYYPEASMLLGLDATKQTGEAYYLCLTLESRNRVLNPPKKKRIFIDKKKKEEEMWNELASIAPRKWRHMGSELEIAEENVYDSRPLVIKALPANFSGKLTNLQNLPNAQIVLCYIKNEKIEVHVSRFRENFGGDCDFEDAPIEGNPNAFVSFESESASKYPFVERVEIDRAIQVMPQKQTASTQTGFFFKRNKMTQHEIQSIATEDGEKIMKSDSIKEFFQKSIMNLLINLQQNSMMDVSEADYEKLKASKGNESDFNNDSLVLKEFQTYCDLRHSKGRCVTQMIFHPTLDDVVVMSVAEDATFDKRIESHSKVLMEPNFVLFWDLKEVAHPQIMLDAPADVFCFQINPSDPHLVCGGCANGQIVLWDLGRVFTEFRNKIQNRRKKSFAMNAGGSKPNFLEKLKDTAEKYACPLIAASGLSNLEQSHKRVVTSVCWVPPHVEIGKNGTMGENTMGGRSCQFFSIAADGSLRLWDTRPPRAGMAEYEDDEKVDPIKATPWMHLENNQWKYSAKYNLDDGTGTMYASIMTISEPKVGDTITAAEVAILGGKSATSDMGTSSDKKLIKSSVAVSNAPSNVNEPGADRPVLPVSIPGGGSSAQTTIFMGTEIGQIALVDWLRNKDGTINMDTGNKTCQNHYLQCFHDGSVTSIVRSPFFHQLILSVGGGTVSIWNEKSPYPVLQSCGVTQFPWCGAWSNTRPGVFFCGTREGSVQVWDLLDRSNVPVFTQQVSPARITDICVPKTSTTKKHFLALTDSEGVLYVLLIPRYYVKPLHLEQNTMKELMNREEKRMNTWVADQDIRQEKLEAMHGSWKGAKVLKSAEESNQEEIAQEEKLRKEYSDFVEFEFRTVGKLKREEPTLPTIDDDIADEFDRLIKAAEDAAKAEEEDRSLRLSSGYTEIEPPPPSEHQF